MNASSTTILKPSSHAGNVTLAALVLWLMLSTCALGMIYQAQKTYLLSKARSEQYLCLRHLTAQTDKIVKTIERLNNAILAAQAAATVAKPAAAAVKALQVAQEAAYAKFLLQVVKQYCQKEQIISFWLNQPYQRKGLIFARRPLGTTISRHSTTPIIISPAGKWIKHLAKHDQFILLLKWQWKNKSLVWEGKELALDLGVSKWKAWIKQGLGRIFNRRWPNRGGKFEH
ncbi:MAG: hypothetical protein J6Y94_04290 [Bacteriovoracaceae bacterium]|nr:hypothetical protein [Bacteriovoracaceae bacterium]